MKYEVQTDTLIDGWVNCWMEDDKLMVFDTVELAQAEIEDAIESLRESHAEAVADGILDGEFCEECERSQLRIVEVKS